MRGWKAKLVFLLIIYFAGFATGIYCLAPGSDDRIEQADKSFTQSAFKSDEFAVSLNDKLHRCMDFAKDFADRTGIYLKEKIKESRAEG